MRWNVAALWLIVVLYALLLVHLHRQGVWMFDAAGVPLEKDFLVFWASGKAFLLGEPEALYDPAHFRDIQSAVLGRTVSLDLPWFYPPSFLMFTAPLTLFDFGAAWLLWTLATVAAYGLAAWRVVGAPWAVPAALAAPAVLLCLGAGQNGLLTAALFGLGLALLPKRPLIAGILFGLMAYKPQFGLVLPIALLIGRHWRAIRAATATVLGLNGLFTIWFGPRVWPFFLEGLRFANDAILVSGRSGFERLQSVYAVVLSSTGNQAWAWALHGLVAAAALALTIGAWRQGRSSNLGAAALITASLAVTPYLYFYDIVVLMMAVLFLAREGMDDGFLVLEKTHLTLAALLPVGILLWGGVAGALTILVLLLAVARRLIAEVRRTKHLS